jgi:tetratricopeptide (TPR) repeat protein
MTQQASNIIGFFEQGKRAAQDGEHEKARELLAQAVAGDPKQLDAWLWLASVTADENTTLQCLQRAVELAPDDQRVQQAMQRVLLGTLERDAFIAYLIESDKTYTITLRNPSRVVIPKARAVSKAFPPPHLSEGERIQHLLPWMVLGLFTLGIVTLLLLPYVLWRSVRVLNTSQFDPIERHRAQVAVLASLTLGVIGVALLGLLLLHWPN